MKSQLKEEALRLRIEQQLGYASIAKLLPVAKSTLSNWLKHYPLSEERIKQIRIQSLNKGEAKIERFRNTMRVKREKRFRESYSKYLKKFSQPSEESQFVAGLMLYLAEGSKKDDYHITLANTDPKVIKFFMRWANQFMDISRSSFRVQLHLYPNMDIDKEVTFWQKELGITREQFYKHQIRVLQKGSFSYRESFRHGTCSVYFSGSDKKRELMAAIKAFVDSFLR